MLIIFLLSPLGAVLRKLCVPTTCCDDFLFSFPLSLFLVSYSPLSPSVSLQRHDVCGASRAHFQSSNRSSAPIPDDCALAGRRSRVVIETWAQKRLRRTQACGFRRQEVMMGVFTPEFGGFLCTHFPCKLIPSLTPDCVSNLHAFEHRPYSCMITARITFFCILLLFFMLCALFL